MEKLRLALTIALATAGLCLVLTVVSMHSAGPAGGPARAQAERVGVEQGNEHTTLARTDSLSFTASYTYYFPVIFRNYRVSVWEPLGLRGYDVKAIAVDPTTPSTLYVGTQNHGMYKSTDSGNTWNQVNNGLWSGASILQVEVDPHNPQTVYVCTVSSGHFFYSLDGGQSWQPGGTLSLIPLALETHPAIPGRLFVSDFPLDWAGGRVYKSDDSGLSWTTVITEQVFGSNIAASALNLFPVYVGTYHGLYRSEDGGNTWTRLTNGLPGNPVSDVALHPTNPLTAYASTETGVFKTIDGGDSWSLWGTDLPPYGAYNLLINGRNPEVQYATSGPAGVYASRDEGKHWQPMNAGLGNCGIYDLELAQTSTCLYAATTDGVWTLNLVGGNEQR